MPTVAEQQIDQAMVTDCWESTGLTVETEAASMYENSKFLQLPAFKPALLC